MQQWYIILILIGIILYKLLNLKEGLNIGGWFKYYRILRNANGDQISINMCDSDSMGDYDPSAPAPAPDDNEQIVVIHGTGYFVRSGLQETMVSSILSSIGQDATADELIINWNTDVLNESEIKASINYCDEIMDEQLEMMDDSIDPADHFNIFADPQTTLDIRNRLLVTFYNPGPDVIEYEGIIRTGNQDRFVPDTFHMAYIDGNGSYTGTNHRGCNAVYNIDRIAENLQEWIDYGRDQDLDFDSLSPGNMKEFNLISTTNMFTRLSSHFKIGTTNRLNKCLKFIEYVRSRLLESEQDPDNFNLTIHVYYDRQELDYATSFMMNTEYTGAYFLEFNFDNTNLNELLINLFGINIAIPDDPTIYTDNPLSDACASRRRFDPGGGE